MGIESYALSKSQNKLVYFPRWGAPEPGAKYKEDHGFAVTDELLWSLVNGGWHREPELVSRLHIKDIVTGKVRVAQVQMVSRRNPIIWLSPNGRYAITEQVPTSVPANWASYEDSFVARFARECT
jgi:hypothetical protein